MFQLHLGSFIARPLNPSIFGWIFLVCSLEMLATTQRYYYHQQYSIFIMKRMLPQEAAKQTTVVQLFKDEQLPSLVVFLYIFLMISSELDDGVLSQTTTLVKSMSLTNGECTHTNIVRVIREQNEREYASPQITNSTAEQHDNTLKRVTEIHYLKVKYIVQDQFTFQNKGGKTEAEKREQRSFISSSQDSGNSNQSNQQNPTKIKRGKSKKLCLFLKTSKNGRHFIKRNTKNIPKNFCKAFINHMEAMSNKKEEWTMAMKDFKKIQRKSKNKYNNILMHRLISNPRICVYFKQFLQSHAAEWINNSKIADKEIHLEAIDIYFKLLDNLAYAEVDPSPSDE